MQIKSCLKSARFFSAIPIILCVTTFLFAEASVLPSSGNRGSFKPAQSQEVEEIVLQPEEAPKKRVKPVKKKKEKEPELTGFQEQARLDRAQGLEAQRVGNVDGALKFYRMALELDPGYALVYNDIGVILEAQGLPDRAEEYYLAAIKLDPKTLGAYSNLALFYENKRELEKAASYWRKRVELGSVGDPWTQKARKRLADLTEVVPSMQEDLRQRETEQLAKEVMVKRKAKLAQVDTHVAKAKKLEQQNKYSEAMNELYTALTLDPKDQDAAVLMDKIQRKILEEKKRARVKEIEAHYKTGLKFYEQNDSQKAKQEFDKANALAAPVPQR